MILCIMQLRLALPVTDLCYQFNISKTTATRIFLETMNIFFVRLKLLMYWPDPPDRHNSMRICFQAKLRTRTKISVIIDCFEIFIERPSNLTARHLTWSSYKQHNTIKYLIGITPQGTIHKELSALILKVGEDALVIKGILRIQIFCQS